jgi:hypothetical protein
MELILLMRVCVQYLYRGENTALDDMMFAIKERRAIPSRLIPDDKPLNQPSHTGTKNRYSSLEPIMKSLDIFIVSYHSHLHIPFICCLLNITHSPLCGLAQSLIKRRMPQHPHLYTIPHECNLHSQQALLLVHLKLHLATLHTSSLHGDAEYVPERPQRGFLSHLPDVCGDGRDFRGSISS